MFTPTTWVNGAAPGISAEQLNRIEQGIVDLDNIASKYGIRYNNTTDVTTRLGNSVGKVAAIYPDTNNFNSIMPWSGMKRCNLADNLFVNAYYGDVDYIEDGTNGQCMVEVPAFYYMRTRIDVDNVDTYISMLPLSGFKLHPWFYDADGHPVTKKYLSTYEGSLYDVTASAIEKDTLTVTAACSSSGNVTITLDQFNIFTVAVLNTDNTTALVAAKLRAAAYTGWTVTGATSDVIFTCNASGAKTKAIFAGGTTGVTATIVQTVVGAGGYVGLDAQVADFTATTGDKLSSVAGVKPCSGKTQLLYIVNSRILATNRGTGWQQQYFNAVSAIQMLLQVEYANLKSQTVIGQGVVNVTDTPVTENNSLVTGGTTSLGNYSGRATGTDGLVSVSYRGVENFWGNIWKWVDGLNIQTGFAFLNKINGTFVSDTFTGNYINVEELYHTNGYMSKSLLNYNFDYGFLPAEALGTSTSKYADYYYQNAVGDFVGHLGGSWYDGASAGTFYWRLTDGSANCNRAFGARLCI